MKIGLFFGSFNPIHIGHLAIANYLVEFTELNQLWFVVSPHNPLKEKASLLNDTQRLNMVNIAIEHEPKLKSSNIEFGLPQPNYTIHTLTHLSEKYPQHQFVLIMGEDNLQSLEKWKNYEAILNYYEIIVYPRPGITSTPFDHHPKVKKVNAPLIEVSSTFIRNAIKEKKNVRFFLQENVFNYIDEMGFYKK